MSYLLVAIVSLGLAQSAHAVIYWTGAQGAAWNNTGNWTLDTGWIVFDDSHVENNQYYMEWSENLKQFNYIDKNYKALQFRGGTQAEPFVMNGKGYYYNCSVDTGSTADARSKFAIADSTGDSALWFYNGTLKTRTFTAGTASYSAWLKIGNGTDTTLIENTVNDMSFTKGTFIVETNATAKTANSFRAGMDGASAQVDINGTLTAGSHVGVGGTGSCVMNVNGGTVTVGKQLFLADKAGFTGEMNVNGDSTVTVGETFGVAIYGTGTFNLNGGIVTVNTGYTTKLSKNSGADGTLNLNGGTLETARIENPGGSGRVVFNGGTLKANKAHSSGLIDASAPVSVGANGGTIDTGAYDITIRSPINAVENTAGAFTVTGGGTATFAATGGLAGALTVGDNTSLHWFDQDGAVSATPGFTSLALGAGSTVYLDGNATAVDALPATVTTTATTENKANVAINFSVLPATGASFTLFPAASADVFNVQPSYAGITLPCEVAVVDGNLVLTIVAEDYTWNGTQTNWGDTDAWTKGVATATWADGNNAIFNTANATATLAADAAARKVTFNADATVDGSATLKVLDVVETASGVSAAISAPTAGALVKTGAGALTLGASRTEQTTVSEGALAMANGATVDPAKLTLGTDPAKPVSLDLGGAALKANLTSCMSATVGGAAGGSVAIDNGEITVPAVLRVWNGSLTLGSGAHVTMDTAASRWVCVGGNNADSEAAMDVDALLVLDGASITNNTGANLGVGDFGSAPSKGTVVVRNGGSYWGKSNIYVAQGCEGHITIDGAGSSVTADSLVFCGEARCEAGENGYAVVTNGGELAVRTVSYRNGAGEGYFRFDGGKLRATADGTLLAANTHLHYEVGANGGTIDNGGFAVKVAQDIAGSGTLTLSGAGTTTLAAGADFACGAAVASGTTLTVGGAGNALGALALADGATLDITTPGAAAAVTLGSGALTLPASGTASLTKGGGAFGAGTYAIYKNTGGTVSSADATDAQNHLQPQLASGMTGLFVANGDTLYLVVVGSGDYVWVGGASGNFSVASNWLCNSVPGKDASIYLVSGTEATLNNDIPDFEPASITFLEGSASVTVNGNAMSDVVAVTNLSASASPEIACRLDFAETYRVHCASQPVNFSGGAYATCPYAENTDNEASHSLMGEIHFSEEWNCDYALSKTYTVPNGSRLYGQSLTGGKTQMVLTVEEGGYAEFAGNVYTGAKCARVSVKGEIVIGGCWIVKNTGAYGHVGYDGDEKGNGIIRAKGIWKGSANNDMNRNVYIKPPSLYIGSDGLGAKAKDYSIHFDAGPRTVYATADFEVFGVKRTENLADWGVTLDTNTTFNTQGHTITWTGGAAGAGALIKDGAGTLVMQPYGSDLSGAVTVNGGTLICKVANAVGSGAVTVNNGATLELEASIANAVTVANGATLAVGGAGNALGALALSDGATLDITTPGAAAAVTLGSGALTLPASGTASLKKGGGAFATGMYAILTKSGITVADVQGKLVPQVADGATYLYKVVGDTLYLTVGAAGDYVWVGGASGNFSVASNWLCNSVPGKGASIYLVSGTEATLNNDIPDFEPASLTFLEGSASVTVNGNAMSNVVAVTNASPLNMTFACPVDFGDGKVDVTATARYSNSTEEITGGCVVFAGGVRGADVAHHTIFTGNYTLTKTGKFSFSTSGNNRAVLNTNATLNVKSTDQIHELCIKHGATFHVESASHSWKSSGSDDTHRLWCTSDGTFVADSYSLNGGGQMWLGGYLGSENCCNLNANAVLKLGTATVNSNGQIWLHGRGNSGSKGDALTTYIGAGGLKIAEGKTGYFGVENKNHTSTIRPLDADFTIGRGSNENYDFMLREEAINFSIHTTDEGGTARTVTLDGRITTEGHTDTTITVKGAGTNVVNSVSPLMVGTYAVADTATVVLNEGAGFANGTVNVGAAATLMVGGAGNALGALALADGATLDITTPGAAAAITLGSGALTLPASGTVSLKKGGGAFATGMYAILTKSGITVADVQDKLVPQVADDATYLYKVGGDTLYLTVGAAGDYVWSGLGDTVTFNDQDNWLTHSVPLAGATVYIAVATNSTLVCDIESFAPTSMVFTAGAQMTIAPGTNCKITGLQTIRNESGVRHVLNVPTEFKSDDADAPIDVTGEIDFHGGVTGTVPANHSKFYGNYTLTATSWPISSAITLAENATVTATGMQITPTTEGVLCALDGSLFKIKSLRSEQAKDVFGTYKGDLTVESIVIDTGGENDAPFPFGKNFTGVLKLGDFTIYPGKGTVYTFPYGKIVVGSQMQVRRGTLPLGRINSSTIVDEFVLHSSGDWTMSTQNNNDYNYHISVDATPVVIDTSDYDGDATGHTVTLSCAGAKPKATNRHLDGSGALAASGNGKLLFNNTCYFTGGLTASNSVTVTVNDGVQPGKGNVSIRDTATLEVKGATTISGELSFVGAGTKLKIGSLTPGKTAITAASLALPESGTVELLFTTAPTAGRTYTLATVTGDQTLTSDDLAKFSVPAGYRLLLADAGKSIVLGGPYTWTGAGAGTLWATGGNWQGGVAPTGACEPGFIEAFITGSRTATFGAADSYTGHLWVDAGTAANPIVFAPSGASGSLSDGLGSYYLYVGQNATEANLVIERGMHLDTGLVRIGGLDTSTARLTVKGSIYSDSYVCLAVDNYTGTPVAVLDIDGGAVTNKKNDLVIGDFLGSGNGQFTAIVQNGGQYVSLGNGIRVSSGSSGTLAITNGTVLAENANVNMGNKDKSGIGRLILGPGALLSTKSVTSGDSTSTGHTLVFGGGTLRASADGDTFIDSKNNNDVARVVVEVESAGGTIDTNGKEVGFRTAASGAGGLTVTGGGELFFDNLNGSRTASAFDYTGATTVAGGTAIRSAATNTTFAGNLVLQSGARVKVKFVSSQATCLSANDVTVASGVRVVPDAVFAKGTYPILTKTGGGSFTQTDVDGMVLDDSAAYGLSEAAHLALGGTNNDAICLVVEYDNVIAVANKLTESPTLTGADVIVGVGGVAIPSLALPENGILVLDPIRTPIMVSEAPVFGSGAKIALSSAYASMSCGKVVLMTYTGEATFDATLFDASSIASGATFALTEETAPDGTSKQLVLTVGDYAHAPEIRILPIGDSITQGVTKDSQGDYPQYRTAIAARLAANGYRPVMKGIWYFAQNDAAGVQPPDDWRWHCGISGDAIKTSSASATSYRGGVRDNLHLYLDVAGYTDVITLLIGTNDLGAGDTAEETYTNWTNLVFEIASQRPDAKIVGATLLDRNGEGTGNHNKVVAFNALLRADYAAGKLPPNLVLLDLFADVPLATPGNFFTDKLHLNWAGCALASEAFAGKIMETLPRPTFAGTADPTVTAEAQTAQGAAATVPSAYRDGMVHVFTLDAANAGNIFYGASPYTATPNPAALTRQVKRAGYYLELVRAGTTRRRYVWVDFDAAGKTLDEVDFPWTGNKFQAVVENLHVYSNDSGIKNIAADNDGVKGIVEATSGSYTAVAGLEGAPDDIGNATCGWNDTLNENGAGYGCFQVHRIFSQTAGDTHWNDAQVLFAWNRWGKNSGTDDLGIGDYACHAAGIDTMDYTYTVEHGRVGLAQTVAAAGYQVRHLEIWAEFDTPRHGVWVGGVSRDFDTGANWEDGLVPAAGEDLWFDGVATDTTVSVTGASTNLFFGKAAMGAQLVTFTGGIGFTNITDTTKVAVGDNSTVTLDGDLVFEDGESTGKYILHSVGAGGMFRVTGKIGRAPGAKGNLNPQISPGAGVIAAGAFFNNGADDYIEACTDSSSQKWAVGPGGITGTRSWWCFNNPSDAAYIHPDTNDFTIAAETSIREKFGHYELNTTGWGDGLPHTITLDAGYTSGDNVAGRLFVAGTGKVIVNCSCGYSGPVTVNGTSTLAVNPGKTLTTGAITVNAGAALQVAESGTVALGGNLTLGNNAVLAFNYTNRAEPVLDLAGKTVTFADSAAKNVTVRISSSGAGVRAHSGKNVLTTGGQFTGATVTLAEPKPKWVKRVEVEDGNIVIYTEPIGILIIAE